MISVHVHVILTKMEISPGRNETYFRAHKVHG